MTGVSLLKSTGLFEGQESKIPTSWPAEVTVPALTMVQIALFDLLQSIGVKPDVLFGHSVGETALLYASGAGSKAMALEIAIPRARGMRLAELVGGGMLALGCNLSSTLRIIAQVKEVSEGVLEISCYNSPTAFVLSGHTKMVDEALALAETEGIFARRIHTLTASHSSVMDVCEEECLAGIGEVFSRYPGPCKPVIPTFSSVDGHEEMISEFTPEYFWKNLRNPVRFQETVESVIEEYPDAVFIEMSPHPVLSPSISLLTEKDPVCPMQRGKDLSASDVELAAFTHAIGSLFILGVNTIDLTTLYGRPSRNTLSNIPYPFNPRQFQTQIDGPRSAGSSGSDTYALRVKMNSKLFPDLAQHVMNNEPILPATAMLDMVCAPFIVACVFFFSLNVVSGCSNGCTSYMGC